MFSGILKICICFCEHVYMVLKFLLLIVAQDVRIEIIFVLQSSILSSYMYGIFSASKEIKLIKLKATRTEIRYSYDVYGFKTLSQSVKNKENKVDVLFFFNLALRHFFHRNQTSK